MKQSAAAQPPSARGPAARALRRGCALLLFLALLSSAALAAAPGDWPAWAEAALDWGQDRAVSQDLLREPEAVVTRGLAAQLLYEAAGWPAVSEACPFSDVPDEYADAVTWAAAEGILNGVGGGRYEPSRSVTRQEFAAILWRQAGAPATAAQGLAPFQDAGSVASWARDAALWCLQTGAMTGRSDTRLAPAGTILVAEALAMLERADALPDVSGIRTDLEALTGAHRPIGSRGEADAAAYLETRFTAMGYTVTRQPYTDDQGRTGYNVIAVREAASPDADILVLSAHHDSVPTAYGANDNASGVAALLYAAEALRDVPTDTELRFLSFTDEENGKNGSRAYTASLPEAERSRIIGDIQLDMLGGLGAGGTVLCTTDGEANWLSDLLQEQDPALALRAETASDHASFQLAGIPSVLVMQDGRGYLYHTSADTADQLDFYAVARAAELVAAAAREIASPDSGSYRALARAQGDGYTYRQTRQNVIYFDSSRAETEAYIGAAGALTDTHEVSGDGWTDVYETYRYAMRWFDGETPMNTYYQYRNGFLERIELRPEETGYTADEVRSLIEAMYGAPTSEEDGQVSWADEIYSKYLTLSQDEAGCLVTVSSYSVGITNVLASYPVQGGQATIDDPEDAAVWDYLCSILPQDARQTIAEFNLFTDGTSNILAYTSPIREDGVTDNTRFSLSIDYYDVYDETGAKRDWSKLTYTILHEYGHVLLEDATQIDLTVGSGTHDPAGFRPGSFRKAFYDAFWSTLGDTGVGDYEANPTHYVSRYGANYFHEDIADTFAVFVLGGEPQGNTVAEEKVRFFWEDAEMTALRTEIRQNLGLAWPEAAAAQPDPQPDTVAVDSLEALQAQLAQAIAAAEQPPAFDVSALTEQERAQLPLTVQNLHSAILSDTPAYKYAHHLEAELGDDGLLRCTVSYMPYRTGDFPEGFQGTAVADLSGLLQAAREGLEQERISIRITDPTLEVDDMNRALQQVGGSYLLCQLSADGTAITVTPQGGLTQAQALERLAETEALAQQVLEETVTADMTTAEQALALYAYLTENVRYDFRYYSQPTEMPYDSLTAYGALHDHLAICGGYAQAFQLLLEQAGIPCVTVNGKLGSEYHMWNLVQIDGQWRYFDPTSDRGRAQYGFLYGGVEASGLDRHTWDQDWATELATRLYP